MSPRLRRALRARDQRHAFENFKAALKRFVKLLDDEWARRGWKALPAVSCGVAGCELCAATNKARRRGRS